MVHRLRTFLVTLGDLLLPRRAEIKLIANETTGQFARFYTPHQHHTTIALSHYQEAPVRAAIHATKFYHNRHAAALLAHLLDRYLATLPTNTILIPLPLSPRRERERGHNQIVTVLSYCAHPLAKNQQRLLRRVRETPPQSHRTRHERLHNVRHCFTATLDHTIPKQTVLLIVDDVVTTGATLEAATIILKQAYPELTVRALALAH